MQELIFSSLCFLFNCPLFTHFFLSPFPPPFIFSVQDKSPATTTAAPIATAAPTVSPVVSTRTRKGTGVLVGTRPPASSAALLTAVKVCVSACVVCLSVCGCDSWGWGAWGNVEEPYFDSLSMCVPVTPLSLTYTHARTHVLTHTNAHTLRC